MRYQKDKKVESKTGNSEKAVNDINNIDDVSLHASSQDSLMVEISSHTDNTTVEKGNGDINKSKAVQPSEKREDVDPGAAKMAIDQATVDNMPSSASTQNDQSSLSKGMNQASSSTVCNENKTSVVGEGADDGKADDDDDDDDVILIVDSPAKEDACRPRAIEQIEKAVKNLKSAFLQGEEELANLVSEANLLKEEQTVNEELLQYKRGGAAVLKRSMEEVLCTPAAKRAKVEDDFLKEVEENFETNLKYLKEEISSLESQIHIRKETERVNICQRDLLQSIFLKYSRTYGELVSGSRN